MAINDAMSTAVMALQAQSYALENISSNIANSQTTAYKSYDTSFADLVTGSTTNSPTAGVSYASVGSADVQGSVVANVHATYLAIDGSGYFAVSDASGNTSGTYYTRRGDFELDKNGNLVNGAGYALMGVAVDPNTGELAGSTVETIEISNDPLPPRATTSISYEANLPSDPGTAAGADGGSDIYTGGALTNVTADGAEDFLDQSIPGGTITVYNASGAPVTVELRWAKVAEADPNASPPVEDTWNLYYLSDSSATGTGTEWTNVGTNFTFDASGALSGSSPTSVTLANLTVNGSSVGDVAFNMGKGLTQYADSLGQVTVSAASQDGYGSGTLKSVQVSDSGRVTAVYSNGQTREVAQVAVATFNAPNQLDALGSGIYAATGDSGEAIYDLTGAKVVASALEASNADITSEFTKLIVTQQAYAAATRVVSTSDEMVQQALNMIR